jgi:hypothetical protein
MRRNKDAKSEKRHRPVPLIPTMAFLRKAAERSIEAFWTAIGSMVNRFVHAECKNYFAAARYPAT